MKLIQLYSQVLREIGEGSSQPFEYEKTFGSGKNFAYLIKGKVSNENGDWDIGINLQSIWIKLFATQKDGKWFVNGEENQEFGEFLNAPPGSDLGGFEITFSHTEGNAFAPVNDKTFMFRLMATIKEILQEEFNRSNPDFIAYSPTKEGDESIDQTGRHKLYSAFIKKAFPNARMFVNKGNDEIIYKLQ